MCQERSRHPRSLTLVGVLWIEAKHQLRTAITWVGKYLLRCTEYVVRNRLASCAAHPAMTIPSQSEWVESSLTTVVWTLQGRCGTFTYPYPMQVDLYHRLSDVPFVCGAVGEVHTCLPCHVCVCKLQVIAVRAGTTHL